MKYQLLMHAYFYYLSIISSTKKHAHYIILNKTKEELFTLRLFKELIILSKENDYYPIKNRCYLDKHLFFT